MTVVVNKKTARKKGWNRIKIIRETVKKLFYHFIALLLSSKSRGKVIVESATAEKDQYYLKEFSYFLSPATKELSANFKTMQKTLTSISFVTKNNYDIEEQIADLFAYGAKCKYEKEVEKFKFDKNSYESKIISIFEKKLFVKPRKAREGKEKFYERIVPFCVLPKN